MTGRNVQLGGVVGVRRAERALLARNPGIDLALGGLHRELVDRALWHALVHGGFRSGGMGGTDDEVAVLIGGSIGAVREFFGLDITRRVRVARRGRGTRR